MKYVLAIILLCSTSYASCLRFNRESIAYMHKNYLYTIQNKAFVLSCRTRTPFYLRLRSGRYCEGNYMIIRSPWNESRICRIYRFIG